MIPPPRDKEAEESKAGGCSSCCKRCATCCCWCLGLYILALVALGAVAFSSPKPESCAIVEASMNPMPKDFPMVIGTRENIAAGQWPISEVDLTGIWWIQWADSDQDDRSEVLVSFADSAVDNTTSGNVTGSKPLEKNASGKSVFPVVLRQPAQLERHWGYSGSGHKMTSQVLFESSGSDPERALNYKFDNSTSVMIEGIGPLTYKTKDEWRGENFGGKYNYHLVRIIDENGNPDPEWWKKFADFMGDEKLMVWGTSDKCRRRCELASASLMVPAAINCKVCNRFC